METADWNASPEAPLPVTDGWASGGWSQLPWVSEGSAVASCFASKLPQPDRLTPIYPASVVGGVKGSLAFWLGGLAAALDAACAPRWACSFHERTLGGLR